MSVAELEQRVAALERELAELKATVGERPKQGWESTIGAFANDPLFDEAVRLGREWRDEENKDRGE
jgi:hypothetical protein